MQLPNQEINVHSIDGVKCSDSVLVMTDFIFTISQPLYVDSIVHVQMILECEFTTREQFDLA